MHELFKNPGRKIKQIATVAFWVVSIAYIISAFAYASENYYDILFWLLLLLGPCTSYISALFLVGFGELVENSSNKSNALLAEEELPDL